MILITICAVAWAAAATWKMRKLKKDVYDFADAVLVVKFIGELFQMPV